MRLRFLFIALVSCRLAACSGGISVPPKGLPANPTAEPVTVASGVPTALPTNAPTGAPPSATPASSAPTATPAAVNSPGATPAPSLVPTPSPTASTMPTAPPSTYLLISNNTANDYLQFRDDASGNAAPLYTSPPNVCGTCNGIASDPQDDGVWYVGADDKTIYSAKSNTSFTSSAIGAANVITIDGSENVYVGDGANGAIEEFAHTDITPGQKNNLTPFRTIAGSLTQLGDISGLAVDGNLTLYATIYDSDKVLEFPSSDNGNVAPQALTGSNTMLSATYGVAVDSAGNVAVATQSTGLLIFDAPATSGNVAPSAHTVTQLSGSDEGVCYDDFDDHIYVVKSDGSAVQFDGNGNYIGILTGAATDFNHPKNCAVANADFVANEFGGSARPGRFHR